MILKVSGSMFNSSEWILLLHRGYLNIKAVKAADECTDRTLSEILCVSRFVRMDNVSLCLLEERPTSSLKPHTFHTLVTPNNSTEMPGLHFCDLTHGFG